MNPKDAAQVEFAGELGAMLRWQNALSHKLGVNFLPPEEAARAMVECLTVEGAEALAHFLTKTKPWKPQTVNMDEVKEEMIDVLHFLLAFFNIVGMDENAIVEAYRTKNLRNYERITEKLAQMAAQ